MHRLESVGVFIAVADDAEDVWIIQTDADAHQAVLDGFTL